MARRHCQPFCNRDGSGSEEGEAPFHVPSSGSVAAAQSRASLRVTLPLFSSPWDPLSLNVWAATPTPLAHPLRGSGHRVSHSSAPKWEWVK